MERDPALGQDKEVVVVFGERFHACHDLLSVRCEARVCASPSRIKPDGQCDYKGKVWKGQGRFTEPERNSTLFPLLVETFAPGQRIHCR